MSRALPFAALAVCLVAGCVEPDAAPGVRGAADSASCGRCHTTQYEAWQGSTLSRGTASPVFAALVEQVERDWGTAAAAQCVRCHEPRAGGPDDPGVGCVACHAAVSMEAPRDALLRIDLDVPLAGPFGDTDARGAHGVRHGELLSASQLCASCHEVSGPGLFVETTGREHEAYRARQASLGEPARTCVECHLAPLTEGPIAALPGLPSRRRVDHGFVGMDPPWHADAETAARSAERTRALLAEALSIELVEACDGSPGTAPRFVRVTNVGAGHDVPSGVAMLRDVWVDVRVLDDAGAVVATAPRVIELGGRMLDGDDLEVALITHADRVDSRSLAPGEARCQALVWPVDEVPGTTIEATLRAVAIKPAVLEVLGLQALDGQMPRHEIARVVGRIGTPREE